VDKKIKIYTKTGDDGTTGLVGGTRVKKYNARLEAYGTIDELNAHIGKIRSYPVDEDAYVLLTKIQHILFNIGSRLASDERGDEFTSSLSVTEKNIDLLENAIDKFENELPEITAFILPGGDELVAQCHIARTVCRRAERRIVEFAETEKVEPEIVQFINRLSDLLFVLARKLGADRGIEETQWEH